jgi:hypothetical protein
MEDLTGIRERVTVGKSQRRSHHSWAFHQLREFVTYKALLAGVKLVLVVPNIQVRAVPDADMLAKRIGLHEMTLNVFSAVYLHRLTTTLL